MNRFRLLQKKLTDKQYSDHYHSFMSDIIAQGDAELVPVDEIDSPDTWYTVADFATGARVARPPFHLVQKNRNFIQFGPVEPKLHFIFHFQPIFKEAAMISMVTRQDCSE